MTITLRCVAASDTGLMRSDNQDSGYAGPRLAAVADGVSGNVHGEVASAVTIDALARLDHVVPDAEAPDALRSAISAADHRLQEMADANPALQGMSTTLTALLCGDAALYLAQVGDSRAYLLRDDSLRQVSKDHSLVQALVDNGQLTPAEAAVHPQRSVILRAINGRGDVEADVTAHEVRPGDRWLLCSDGLSDYVAGALIEQTISGAAPAEQLVNRLIELANEAGGPDNITCVIADVEEAASPGEPMLVGAAAEDVSGADPDDEPTARLRRV
ncbi:MAG: SpoIIE family protein phosphatase [Streptosporangiales bacterium]|nr:SpoIIE family protein phosphatase [Streptosporangiales bacterium]